MVTARAVGLVSLFSLVSLAALPAQADTDAWWQGFAYYNEDEWYDPTDWFDGNNYEFDRQAYEAYTAGLDDAGQSDYDYGYNDRTYADDWFYDFYDDGYALYYDHGDNGTYDYYFRYYDFDDDQIYDAFAGYFDNDGDGVFEDVEYYNFGQVDRRSGESARRQPPPDAMRRQVEGEIAHLKWVQVRNSEHVVASIEQQDGSQVVVDLGPARNIRRVDLDHGDRISASGPSLVVGDKRILLAKHMEVDGESVSIARNTRWIEGEIVQLDKASVRGTQHWLAKLETSQGRQLTVDLGPANRLRELSLEAGNEISVTGPTVKMRDRRVLMATHVWSHDQSLAIRRGTGEGNVQTARKQQTGFEISGEVARLKYVDVRGVQHAVVHIRTEQGHEYVVDLGPADNLDFEIANDEQLTARGTLIEANDRRVLLARQVEVGQESMTIDRSQPERQISGEVIGTRTVQLRGQQRLLARVETNQGRRVLVDLGPREDLQNAPEEGDSISATGMPVKAGQQPVLVARQFRLGDRTVEIERRQSRR